MSALLWDYLFIYFYLYFYFYNKKIDSALYYVFERVYYFKFNFMKGEYPWIEI